MVWVTVDPEPAFWILGMTWKYPNCFQTFSGKWTPKWMTPWRSFFNLHPQARFQIYNTIRYSKFF